VTWGQMGMARVYVEKALMMDPEDKNAVELHGLINEDIGGGIEEGVETVNADGNIDAA